MRAYLLAKQPPCIIHTTFTHSWNFLEEFHYWYDKRDTFSFSIVNFPHTDSNIPSKPAYGVAISQLVRYLRICCNYQDFAYRSKLLTTRLLRQGYVYQKLCSTYKTFVHRYPMTLQKYGRCLKNIITECIALPTV